jgi:hypothetical protein
VTGSAERSQNRGRLLQFEKGLVEQAAGWAAESNRRRMLAQLSGPVGGTDRFRSVAGTGRVGGDA